MSGLKYLLLFTALTGVASAQTDDVRREETVIVTSPGPERLAGELISKVDALDRDDLIADMGGTLGDTLAKRPGVTTTYFGAGASRPVLRGLGAERVLVLTNGMGVIDASAASPDHQTGTDGLDAQRIEILRGPAALAYGGQAIGGVVNVIDGLLVDELPDEAFTGQAFGAYNSVSEGRELAGQGQAVFGDFVLSLSASGRDFDDYDIPGFAESARLRAMEEDDHDHDHEDEDEHEEHEEDEEIRDSLTNSFLETETLAAGLSWVGDQAYFGLAIRQQTSDYGLPGHSHEHGHEEEDEHEGDEDHDDDDHEEEEHEDEFASISLEQTRIDGQFGWRFSHDILDRFEVKLTSVDYEHAEFEGPGEIGTQYFTEGYEGRAELDHSFGESFGTLGIQVSDKDFRAEGEEAFISPTNTKGIGAFLFETREWDNGFGVEGGLRLEQVEYDNDVFGEREFDLLSGSFGVHQHWVNGWFIGGQISMTHRAPNESELFADGPHLATDQYEVGDATLDSERGLNFEATTRWSNDWVSFGANLFHTDFADYIYLTPGETLHDGLLSDEVDELPVFLFVQEDASFQGGEIYGTLDFTNGLLGADWTIDAGLDFVSSKLDGGGNLPYLPPVTFNGDVSADWGMFDAGIGLTVADDQTDTGDGILPTEGYTTLDLDAGFDLAGFVPNLDTARLFIQAKNVTDEEVRYATSVLKDQLPAPGRNIRVGVSARF